MENVSLAVLYINFNMCSSLGIVFANKAVFAVFHFPYPLLLTLIHIGFTAVGMQLMASAGMFDRKALAWRSVLDLSIVYVGYIVLGNLSIKLNPVGFYQIVKALIPPAVLLVTTIQTRTLPAGNVLAAVTLLTGGVIAATVTDDEVMSNLPGMLTGVACVFATAGYNVLAGSKQKQLSANSSQLCLCFSPLAAGLLATALPLLEPAAVMSFFRPWHGDVAASATPNFRASPAAIGVILLSAVLGLLVTLSTFLVIGATSALTYNVVGHIKTVGVIAGGVLFYGETMPLKKLLGLIVMAVGISWYSHIKLTEAPAPKPLVPATVAPATPITTRRSHSPVAMPLSARKTTPRGPLETSVPVSQELLTTSRSRQERAWAGQAVSPRKSAAFDS